MVKSYCVKQKKQTECVSGSERYVKAKNGTTMMKCTCAECGITKTKFVKSGTTGSGLDELFVKGLFNLGRAGVAKAVRSDAAKKKIKKVANQNLDQALDSFTSDLSKKLDPTQSGSGRKASTKPYCGIGKVPKDRIRGNRSQCIDQGQIRYYGLILSLKRQLKQLKSPIQHLEDKRRN